jgi:hypothetical protein
MLDGADVTVSELVGALWLARGNAKTKSDGSYTATLKDYKDGPIRITVDSLGNTKMICDVPSGCIDKNGAQKGFGASVDIGEGLTMEAILSKKSDTAYVTPLTHLAAGYIVNSTEKIDSDRIKSAHLEVASSFGLTKILGVKPADASSDVSDLDSDVQYMALTISSIAEMMASYDDGDGLKSSTDFSNALVAFNNDFKSGSFSLVDNEHLAGNKSLYSSVIDAKNNLLHGSSEQYVDFRKKNKMSPSNSLESASATQFIIEKIAKAKAKGDTAITPTKPNLGNSDAVSKAKLVVSDIRTLITSLDKSRDYSAPFQDKIDIAAAISSAKIDEHFTWIGYAVGAVFENLNDDTIENKEIILPGNKNVRASLTVTEKSNTTIVGVKAAATDINPAINLVFETNFTLEEIINDAATKKIVNLMLTGEVSESDESVTTKINDVSVVVELNQDTELKVVSYNDFKELSLNGDINAIVAAQSGQAQAEMNGVFSATIIANNQYSETPENFNLNLKGIVLNGKMTSGSQSMDAKVQFIGSGDLINLDRSAAESDKNFYKGILHISLDTALTGYPNTDVLITFNRDKADTGEAIVNIHQRDKERVLVVHLGLNNLLTENTLAKTMSVTSNDNTKLILTKSESEGNTSVNGTVSVGGIVIANIENGGRITYLDGTFEWLNF